MIIFLLIVIIFFHQQFNYYRKTFNYLKNKHYSNNEIKIIFKYLNKKEINKILLIPEKINHLNDYLNNNDFVFNHLERYLNYEKININLNYEKIIKIVNMFLDYEFYEKITIITNPDNLSILVNKYYHLTKDYVPNDLVPVISNCSINQDILVREEVKKAFEEMCTDLRTLNLTIKITSGYRSFETQQTLYDYYLNKKGPQIANLYLAKPGHSEHQTGLAVDVYNGFTSYLNFNYTKEYRWLKNNAHQYGFIVRYPKDKKDITGYEYEPWHLRYVGQKIAAYIYNNQLTLEEYYAEKQYQKNKY